MKYVRHLAVSAMMIMLAASSYSQVRFTVSGLCPDSIGKVVLSDIGTKSVLAEVNVVDGHFSYSGSGHSLALLGVDIPDRHVRFFVDSTDVFVNFHDGSVSGSELNQNTARCFSQIDSVYRRYFHILYDMDAEWSTADDSRKKELEKEASEIMERITASQIMVLRDYKDSLVPAAFLNEMYNRMSLSDLDDFMDTGSPYYNHNLMRWVRQYYDGKQKRRPGIMYADLLLDDMEGNPHSLSEWCGKGNYVLVDFWASWCGPCRKEIPTIMEGYVKYHRKGFEVVGVSFDDRSEAWKTAIRNLGMDWIQLSDLKGWKSIAAESYGVSSIPSNILLDGEGCIVASDLRGEALLAKLREIYGF